MLNLSSVHFDDFIPAWRNQEMETPWHILAIVTQGKVLYTLNGQRHTAEKGEILYIPKGTLRSAENDESGPHQKFTILFNYEADEKMSIPFLNRQTICKLRVRHFSYLVGRCVLLNNGYGEIGTIDRLLALNLAQEILLLLSREAELEGVSPAKLTLATKMQSYLRERYRQPVTVSELAQLIGRSPNYTSSLFKEVTGQSPIQFVLNLRIAEARRLLMHSDMQVSEISHYLGFYDTSYFFRTFKKIMSVTPAEFRARNVL